MEGPHRHAGKSKYPENSEKPHMWILMSVCVGETLLLNRRSLIDRLNTSERLCLWGKKSVILCCRVSPKMFNSLLNLYNLYMMV